MLWTDSSVALSPESVQVLKRLYRLGKDKPEAGSCNILTTTTTPGDSQASTGIKGEVSVKDVFLTGKTRWANISL